MSKDNHLSDNELLLAADGELSSSAAARVRSHLSACWTCRARKQELDSAVISFVQTYHRTTDARIPSADGSRALLKARMAEMAKTQRNRWQMPWRDSGSWRWAFSALLIGCVASASWLIWPAISPSHVRAATFTVPDPALTPGATVFISGDRLCRETREKNKKVSRDLQRRVFDEYGIPGAAPRYYEVDYLITPALGGADDIRNLWPESSASTDWNAEVKDALEDHLRSMVCSGQLDLATAQREIAMNWIEAYKKYFHTERPLQNTSRE
jgi:hypothetical protein